MDQLKLAALDEEDLAVISAHVQDAVLKVGDIRFLPREDRLLVVMNRFAWDKALGKQARDLERRRAALSFARASNVKATRIRQGEKDAVLSLLAIEFAATDAPAGRVTLYFSGGAALSFDVECIEAQLADLGAAWATEHMPKHEA
ncbi:DUF2948 family protein [Rhizobiales bacterium]|uniref:DUF2948 family protein n=1 Tax=Hongsoonwoonella zoysiae TaxID=2821844 RepID=UPI0015602983|nr:DUF2948 family protein [Hongsoonwoonella zoysiae]NRG19551.1 DUF2948 family protein [Hongsoonwoonella zoysiae]